MQFNQSSFNLDTPESWLIVLAYAVFFIYSYYSLVVCLIHVRKENLIQEMEDNPLEIQLMNSLGIDVEA